MNILIRVFLYNIRCLRYGKLVTHIVYVNCPIYKTLLNNWALVKPCPNYILSSEMSSSVLIHDILVQIMIVLVLIGYHFLLDSLYRKWYIYGLVT